MDGVAVLSAKFAVMRKVADERTWRVYLGMEALALGRGGIRAVALAAGVSETMVAAGIAEIESGGVDELPPGRSRRAGGGRKKAEDAQPGLREAPRPVRPAGPVVRPAGDPVRVRDHDFPNEELGKITLYGVYDIAANRGFVAVGTSRDTGAFAVHAIRLWWQREGSSPYPGAGRPLIVCDAGGSNGWRCRLWRHELALLSEQTGLQITVLHFPPGTCPARPSGTSAYGLAVTPG